MEKIQCFWVLNFKLKYRTWRNFKKKSNLGKSIYLSASDERFLVKWANFQWAVLLHYHKLYNDKLQISTKWFCHHFIKILICKLKLVHIVLYSLKPLNYIALCEKYFYLSTKKSFYRYKNFLNFVAFNTNEFLIIFKNALVVTTCVCHSVQYVVSRHHIFRIK